MLRPDAFSFAEAVSDLCLMEDVCLWSRKGQMDAAQRADTRARILAVAERIETHCRVSGVGVRLEADIDRFKVEAANDHLADVARSCVILRDRLLAALEKMAVRGIRRRICAVAVDRVIGTACVHLCYIRAGADRRRAARVERIEAMQVEVRFPDGRRMWPADFLRLEGGPDTVVGQVFAAVPAPSADWSFICDDRHGWKARRR